jgi:hypothetical protein
MKDEFDFVYFVWVRDVFWKLRLWKFIASEHTDYKVIDMLHPFNLKYLKQHSTEILQNVINRKSSADIPKILNLYNHFITSNHDLTQLKKSRNSIPIDNLDLLKQLKKDISQSEKQLASIEQQLYTLSLHLPNSTHPDTPVGDETQAIVLETVNAPRVSCGNHKLHSHLELTDIHKMTDFERAGKVTGSSFYYLLNMGALLEFALVLLFFLIIYSDSLCTGYLYKTRIHSCDSSRRDSIPACSKLWVCTAFRRPSNVFC